MRQEATESATAEDAAVTRALLATSLCTPPSLGCYSATSPPSLGHCSATLSTSQPRPPRYPAPKQSPLQGRYYKRPIGHPVQKRAPMSPTLYSAVPALKIPRRHTASSTYLSTYPSYSALVICGAAYARDPQRSCPCHDPIVASITPGLAVASNQGSLHHYISGHCMPCVNVFPPKKQMRSRTRQKTLRESRYKQHP